MWLAITSPFAARPVSNSVGRGVPPRRGGVGTRRPTCRSALKNERLEVNVGVGEWSFWKQPGQAVGAGRRPYRGAIGLTANC